MRFIRLFRLPLLLLALAVGGVALAAPANAGTPAPAGHQSHDWHPHSPAKVKVKGGSTSLTVDKATAAVLAENKVTVRAVYGAGGKAPTFRFPITGGSVDPRTAAGTITHSGGLKIAAGMKSVVVKDFTIDTRSGVLTARVAGTSTRIPLLKLDTSSAAISGSKGWLVVTGVRATLTSQAAAALNTTFGVSLFEAGLPIGTAAVYART
ncbi:HtaA domain-containing protein [Pseudonocardia sp.]|uniref:HtaA domain-containing protein n=1 Tax=Pseudonocardia sp. TaxID=60912 RepID=UPI003D1300A6